MELVTCIIKFGYDTCPDSVLGNGNSISADVLTQKYLQIAQNQDNENE
jgi:hypothetical protein